MTDALCQWAGYTMLAWASVAVWYYDVRPWLQLRAIRQLIDRIERRV